MSTYYFAIIYLTPPPPLVDFLLFQQSPSDQSQWSLLSLSFLLLLHLVHISTVAVITSLGFITHLCIPVLISYRHKADSKYLSIQHVYCTLCVSEIMQSAGDTEKTAPTSSSVPAFNLCLQQCLNHPHFFR